MDPLLSMFVGLVFGLVLGYLLAMAYVDVLKLDRTIELRFKQKDMHCDVWSTQPPGLSSVGQTVGPALVSFLRQHGEKLNIRLVEEPFK
ncbi:MAG TPA: hypothetical protein VJ553_03940 [Candidatus Paceibacterota bacterium]|nr:hypothetical protein [Candidatus Paceibacterota bacterium]